MNTEVSRITLRSVLYCIRKRLLLIVLCALAGFAAGMTVWIVQSAMASNHVDYKITASIAISAQSANGAFVGGNYQNPNATDIYLAEDLADTVIYVCGSDIVLNEIVQENNLMGLSAQSIRQNLTLSRYGQTQIIEISLIWANAADGASILDTMMEIVPKTLIDTLQLGSVTVVNPPTATRVTYEYISAGGIAVLTIITTLLGILFSIRGLIFHPTLLDPKEVGRLFSLQSFGEIPEDRVNFGLPNPKSKSSSSIQESYVSTVRILINQIESDGPQKLCVTSSIQGEGKTSVAANLAYQLSKLGKKVLLLDLDIRKPSLGGLLLGKTDHKVSLNAAYYDEIDLKQAIITVAQGFDFIPTRLEKRSILLDKKVFHMIEQVESQYDIVLIDTSPAGQVADVMSLKGFADRVLYVIRFDAARVDTIQSDLDRLRKAGMHILGCIVNGIDTSFTDDLRYYNYYSKYGKAGYGIYGDSKEGQTPQRKIKRGKIKRSKSENPSVQDTAKKESKEQVEASAEEEKTVVSSRSKR